MAVVVNPGLDRSANVLTFHTGHPTTQWYSPQVGLVRLSAEKVCTPLMVSVKSVLDPLPLKRAGVPDSGPTAPSVSLLPPSPLQLSEGSASLLCLLSGYSPQGALVSWTVDGSEVKNGVLTSAEEEKYGRYSRSSTLTLSKDLWEKGEEFIFNSDDQCDERVGLAVDSVLCVVLQDLYLSVLTQLHGTLRFPRSRHDHVTSLRFVCTLSPPSFPNKHLNENRCLRPRS
ncbi:hypothetical protein QTP86_013009 [Hemibagrus guttatus]|nr:hypothetical protein QTP86_013009 [Hemibagrus guttatus]